MDDPDLDLFGVRNQSDCRYTLRSTALDFLLPAGCDFNNMVKRIHPFPFVWAMKVRDSDPREKLDERGAPALFIKKTIQHGRLVTCAAFRTGTKNISTVLSTTHHGHQWEGICLSTRQRILYKEDPMHGLDKFIFEALATEKSSYDAKKNQVKELLDELVLLNVDVFTIEQGTADWHQGRQFSATSSQSSGTF